MPSYTVRQRTRCVEQITASVDVPDEVEARGLDDIQRYIDEAMAQGTYREIDRRLLGDKVVESIESFKDYP